EIVSIMGQSGVGKSTLLHILGTLDSPDRGEIHLNGTDLLALNSRQLSEFRNRQIGFVFQFHHLLPELNALENVCVPAMIRGKSISESTPRATELLDYLGLSGRLTHKPTELSGGEQQRVAIARALINQPKVILADEPTGNLDTESSGELHRLFLTLRQDLQQTFIIVTHNVELAKMSDRILRMKDGLVTSDHGI
ncbi:MAG: ABC transporter ATP-binding protein, partial [Saprospiraceae bacterium]|nr:ABC transporter ATP-binding protein [Saprospiraceae bacterium]